VAQTPDFFMQLKWSRHDLCNQTKHDKKGCGSLKQFFVSESCSGRADACDSLVFENLKLRIWTIEGDAG